jgi:hypothetical protein
MVGFWIRIAFYLAGIGLIGWFFGAIGEPIAGWIFATVVLAWWVVYQLYYLQKTMHWLEDFRLENVPMGAGS